MKRMMHLNCSRLKRQRTSASCSLSINLPFSRVGKNISTKSVGSSYREDITDLYKYQESSQEERAVMLRVLRMSKSSFARYYLNEQFEDVKFELLLLDDIIIGSPFTVCQYKMNSHFEILLILVSRFVFVWRTRVKRHII